MSKIDSALEETHAKISKKQKTKKNFLQTRSAFEIKVSNVNLGYSFKQEKTVFLTVFFIIPVKYLYKLQYVVEII